MCVPGKQKREDAPVPQLSAMGKTLDVMPLGKVTAAKAERAVLGTDLVGQRARVTLLWCSSDKVWHKIGERLYFR